jgi:uncharacterized protein YndB with AHSA1/START domain
MATNRMTIKATPETVFGVLADGHAYERWLVGCKKIRAVDDDWPAPGSRFHHRVGIAGPLTLDDNTLSLECEQPRGLVLEARARPAGVARVEFVLEHDGAGGCVVTIHEEPVRGPAKLIHNPLLDALVSARNEKSLKQLRVLSETATSAPPTAARD